MPEGVILPHLRTDRINVFGCGLMLDPEDELWIFFTINGALVGKLALQILRVNKKKWMLIYISN
jgi:hypothetical protein